MEQVDYESERERGDGGERNIASGFLSKCFFFIIILSINNLYGI